MIDNDEIIDAKFLLDWNENSERFKFYVDKFTYSTSLRYFLNSLYGLLIFIVAESLVLFIIKNLVIVSEDSYNFFKDVIFYGGVVVLTAISSICLVLFLLEVYIIYPKMRIKKSNKFYVTDGNGIYMLTYTIGKNKQGSCYCPSLTDKIVSHFSNIKLDPSFFDSVRYLSDYNIVSMSSSYVVLDIPEDNSLCDEVYDYEISSTVKGFKELREYLESTEGGYYID